jgi:hypothetical protein
MRTRTLLSIGSWLGGLVVGSAVVACNSDSGATSTAAAVHDRWRRRRKQRWRERWRERKRRRRWREGRNGRGLRNAEHVQRSARDALVDTSEGDLIGSRYQRWAPREAATRPGPRNGVVGGGGLLWIWGPTPFRTSRPCSRPARRSRPSRSRRATIRSSALESCGCSGRTTLGAAIPSVFAIASPTSVTKLHTNYAPNASAVNADGYSCSGRLPR